MSLHRNLVTLLRTADEKTLDRVRVLLAAESPSTKVDSPIAAVDQIRPLLLGREREALVVLALNRRRAPIDMAVLSEGSADFTIVDPKAILRWALTRTKAVSAIILAHNHPSGDPTPSAQDVEVTTRVARACDAVGIPLLDHIVITDDGYCSLQNEGKMPSAGRYTTSWTAP